MCDDFMIASIWTEVVDCVSISTNYIDKKH